MRVQTQVPARFQQWRSQIPQLPSQEAAFEKWLFLHLASVLLADKAGELLTLSSKEFGLSMDWRIERLKALAETWACRARVLHETERTTKVIIYQPDLVEQALAELEPELLCGQLGYPTSLTAALFVTELAQRWQNTQCIPHEVGLALGYPVKDVLGFMGLCRLECTGMCGWRIYGDPKQSHRLSQQFFQAKQKAAVLMATC